MILLLVMVRRSWASNPEGQTSQEVLIYRCGLNECITETQAVLRLDLQDKHAFTMTGVQCMHGFHSNAVASFCTD